MLKSRELLHQRSPDNSADQEEELGPAPASDPRPGVRSNNSSIERFPVQFSSIQFPRRLPPRVRVSLHASLSEDVDAHVRAHLYELAIFNPLKRADAVLRWTPAGLTMALRSCNHRCRRPAAPVRRSESLSPAGRGRKEIACLIGPFSRPYSPVWELRYLFRCTFI
jgi:hypothetical protein